MSSARAERNARAADEAAQQTAAAEPLRRPVPAPGYVRALHPVHGQVVTYTPGELLPLWASVLVPAEAFATGDHEQVVDLTGGKA